MLSGFGEQTQTKSLTYFILTGKSENIYNNLLSELKTLANKNSIELCPEFVMERRQ